MTSRNQPVSHASGRFPHREPSAQLAAAWHALLHDETHRRALDEPGRLLSAYFRERERSPLGQVVATANKLAAACETVLVVAPRDAVRCMTRLVEATCHPFHNLLKHGGRAGRARLVLLEAGADNDLLQGALDLVRHACDGPALHERWALLVVAPRDHDDEFARRGVADAAAPLVAALREAAASDDDLKSRLLTMSEASIFDKPKLIDADLPHTALPLLDPSLYFNGPALFAATLVGDDTVTLMKGAVWFWEAAKSKPAAESPIVQMAEYLARPGCRLAAWHHGAESICREFVEMVGLELLAPFCAHDLRRLLAEPQRPALHIWAESVRRDRTTPSVDDRLSGAYACCNAEAEIRLTRPSDVALGELCQWFRAVQILRNISARSEI